MTDTKTSWGMNIQVVAQLAHFFGAYSVLFTAAALKHPHLAFWLIVVAAAIKEFFYDLRYELPKQTFWDSAEDFAFYLVGTGAALGVSRMVGL